MADSDSDYASDDDVAIDETEFTCENVRRSTARATRRRARASDDDANARRRSIDREKRRRRDD
jgi:hypothetical protein